MGKADFLSLLGPLHAELLQRLPHASQRVYGPSPCTLYPAPSPSSEDGTGHGGEATPDCKLPREATPDVEPTPTTIHGLQLVAQASLGCNRVQPLPRPVGEALLPPSPTPLQHTPPSPLNLRRAPPTLPPCTLYPPAGGLPGLPRSLESLGMIGKGGFGRLSLVRHAGARPRRGSSCLSSSCALHPYCTLHPAPCTLPL